MHSGRPAARPSRAEHSNYDGSYSSSAERSRYEERYQAERADGRYSYNYNRSERPHRSAAPGRVSLIRGSMQARALRRAVHL